MWTWTFKDGEAQLGERYGELPGYVGGFSPEQIQREYILGERYGETPRESIIGVNGLEQYRQSERTFVDPLAGMTTYLNNERSSIPVRNLTSFNPYQISEWFGK